MRKCLLLFLLAAAYTSYAQELNARVNVNSANVSSNTNKAVFATLQTAITNFINTRKWTNDNYLTNEKIDCSFLLTLQATSTPDVYSATLTVQAGRPIFNSSYLSPIINYQDKDMVFKYIEFQPLDFNENNIAGIDPESSNLTAVLAYYVDMILAFEYDSFAQRGGDPYFQKAQNIVNNAPEDASITGWKAFDGIRNRYWLIENMENSRYTIMHDIYYNYYRLGMDKLYENEREARAQILNVLNQLNSFSTDNTNTMIQQFFFQGKSDELMQLFSKADPGDKIQAAALLEKLDITNSTKYKNGLQ
jgi:Domain of unknown function (DUF4835)